MTDYVGTPGDDTIAGTDLPDTFDLSQGGDDTVDGKDGNDVFNMGGAFTSGDQIVGGAGFDTLALDGDYSGGETYSAPALSTIERVTFEAGHDYVLKVSGGDVSSATDFQSHLSADDHIALNASQMFGGIGILYEGGTGHETINGSQGVDDFYFFGGLAVDDRVDGREGVDHVYLDGDYSTGLVMTNQTMQHVENLELGRDHSYDLTFAKTTVNTAGMRVNGGHLGPDDTMLIDASKTILGRVEIDGGRGDDTLIGGASGDSISGGKGIDRLTGGGNVDVLTGGAGPDRFIYLHTSDTGDVITDLSSQDIVDLKHVDADTTQAGNQAFHLVASLDGHAGELTLSYDAGADQTSFAGDVNGDGLADLVFHASGDQTGFTHFVL